MIQSTNFTMTINVYETGMKASLPGLKSHVYKLRFAGSQG